MKMSKLRVAVLSLIALVQVLTIVGGFIAYREMSDRYWKLLRGYEELTWKTEELWVTYAPLGNPFVPIFS